MSNDKKINWDEECRVSSAHWPMHELCLRCREMVTTPECSLQSNEVKNNKRKDNAAPIKK